MALRDSSSEISSHSAIVRRKFRGTLRYFERNFVELSDILSKFSFLFSDFLLAVNDTFISFCSTVSSSIASRT